MKQIDHKKTEYYTQKYYKKLHKMVDRIVKQFGGLSQKDMDDFYSLANEVFCYAASDFNGKGNFEGFLYSRLVLKIRSMMTSRNRQKRSNITVIHHEDGSVEKIFHQTLSLDAPIQNDGNSEEKATTYSDILESKYNILNEISDEIGLSFSEKMNTYLENLPQKTRKVAELIGLGYKPYEIRETLKLSQREYDNCILTLKSYENIRILI